MDTQDRARSIQINLGNGEKARRMSMKVDTREALRYLGAGDRAPKVLCEQVKKIAAMLSAAVQPRYTYRVFQIIRAAAEIRLSGTEIALPGKTAAAMLSQCDRAAVLACTLGTDFDTMVRAAQARDMAGAVILDACGSALVETGCDEAEQEIADRFPDRFLTDRFSPGYGDLPLSVQSAVCAALDSQRRLGLFVTPSYLMNPGKSVTAVIGLSHRPQMARVRGCAYCSMRDDCALRKGGSHCEI